MGKLGGSGEINVEMGGEIGKKWEIQGENRKRVEKMEKMGLGEGKCGEGRGKFGGKWSKSAK